MTERTTLTSTDLTSDNMGIMSSEVDGVYVAYAETTLSSEGMISFSTYDMSSFPDNNNFDNWNTDVPTTMITNTKSVDLLDESKSQTPLTLFHYIICAKNQLNCLFGIEFQDFALACDIHLMLQLVQMT